MGSFRKVVYLATLPDLIPRLQLQTKTLVEEGYDVTLVGWDRRSTRPHDEEINRVRHIRLPPYISATTDGVSGPKSPETTFWGVPGQKGLRMLARMPFLYLNLAKVLAQLDPDVLHCCHVSLLPLAAVLGKLKGKKVLYEASDFYISQSFWNLPRSLHSLKRVAIFVEGLFVRLVDGVICIPSRDSMLARGYSKNNSNVTEISNVPLLESFLDEGLRRDLAERFAGRKVIVYAGAISNGKGILNIVKAMGLVRNNHPAAKLVLIGGTIGDDTAGIEKYVRENGLEAHVEVVPFQPYQKLNTYYSAAEIGLVLVDKQYASKLAKGTSRKLIEYMKAALPLLATDDGDIGEMIREEGCGLFVNVLDPDDIARAIERLLGDPSGARSMGERGRKAFERSYNWDKEKEKFLQVYSGL